MPGSRVGSTCARWLAHTLTRARSSRTRITSKTMLSCQSLPQHTYADNLFLLVLFFVRTRFVERLT